MHAQYPTPPSSKQEPSEDVNLLQLHALEWLYAHTQKKMANGSNIPGALNGGQMPSLSNIQSNIDYLLSTQNGSGGPQQPHQQQHPYFSNFSQSRADGIKPIYNHAQSANQNNMKFDFEKPQSPFQSQPNCMGFMPSQSQASFLSHSKQQSNGMGFMPLQSQSQSKPNCMDFMSSQQPFQPLSQLKSQSDGLGFMQFQAQSQPKPQSNGMGFMPPHSQSNGMDFMPPHSQSNGMGFMPPQSQSNGMGFMPPQSQSNGMGFMPPQSQSNGMGFMPPQSQSNGMGFMPPQSQSNGMGFMPPQPKSQPNGMGFMPPFQSQSKQQPNGMDFMPSQQPFAANQGQSGSIYPYGQSSFFGNTGNGPNMPYMQGQGQQPTSYPGQQQQPSFRPEQQQLPSFHSGQQQKPAFYPEQHQHQPYCAMKQQQQTFFPGQQQQQQPFYQGYRQQAYYSGQQPQHQAFYPQWQQQQSFGPAKQDLYSGQQQGFGPGKQDLYSGQQQGFGPGKQDLYSAQQQQEAFGPGKQPQQQEAFGPGKQPQQQEAFGLGKPPQQKTFFPGQQQEPFGFGNQSQQQEAFGAGKQPLHQAFFPGQQQQSQQQTFYSGPPGFNSVLPARGQANQDQDAKQEQQANEDQQANANPPGCAMPPKHVFLNGALYNAELIDQPVDGFRPAGECDLGGQQPFNPTLDAETEDDSYDPMDGLLPSIRGIRFYNPKHGPEGAIPPRVPRKKKCIRNFYMNAAWQPPAHFFGQGMPRFQDSYSLFPMCPPIASINFGKNTQDNNNAATLNKDPTQPESEPKPNPEQPLEEAGAGGGASLTTQSFIPNMSPNSKFKRRQGRNRPRGYIQSFGIVAPLKHNNHGAKTNAGGGKIFPPAPTEKKSPIKTSETFEANELNNDLDWPLLMDGNKANHKSQAKRNLFAKQANDNSSQ